MNEAQRRFGEPKETTRKKVQPVLNEMVQDFIRNAPFAVLATANAEGDCDASPKGGRPGFVKVLDQRRLLLPDVSGNKLFQSYENVESNPRAGLVFLIPGCDWTVRVNGRARAVHPDNAAEGGDGDARLAGLAPEVFASDENTRILQGLEIEVDEAYAHCPRAFLFSELWEIDAIAKARGEDANRYWLGRWREASRDRR
jgi:predicted pyridoxine 5'-phosphate oxidase superfamily flavin-nucleotide-binding protein